MALAVVSILQASIKKLINHLQASSHLPPTPFIALTKTTINIIHAMKSKRNGHNGFLVAKLDMSKAYNRIKWPYLEGVMRTLGFLNKWTMLVMNYVKSVIYSVVVNGKQYGPSSTNETHRIKWLF